MTYIPSQVGGGWTPPPGSGPSKEAVARFELASAVRNSSKTSTNNGLFHIGRVGAYIICQVTCRLNLT